MDYETSDILGTADQPAVREGGWTWRGVFSSAMTLALLAGAAYLGMFYAQAEFKRWQERNHRKAMRRKHGIPDYDTRPFSIAYGDVRKKREQQDGAVDEPVLPTRSNQLNRDSLKRRVAAQTTISSAPAASKTQILSSTTNQPGRLYPTLPISPPPTSFNHNPGVEIVTPQKSRRLQSVDVLSPRRGAKRSADDNDDGADAPDEKRARRISLQKTAEDVDMDSADEPTLEEVEEVPAEEYELDDAERAEANDSIMDLDTPSAPPNASRTRGRKRDRAEAGSTFGGDGYDDDPFSASIDTEHALARERRARRKRRAMGSRVFVPESEAGAGMDESHDFDNRRRNRKSFLGRADDAESDVTMDADVFFEDEAPYSVDPLCKGRRIGEEWELRGQKFKVGPNGQRLRQELVKRIRTKFLMPEDSMHPDKSEDVEYFAEAWMSEEEYQAAKDAHELIWQQNLATVAEVNGISNVDFPSSGDAVESLANGKSLLWSSATESPARRPLRLSSAANSRLNPFKSASPTSNALVLASPTSSTRRIATVPSSTSGAASPAAESPRKQSLPRSFSKWEKQDMEAEAMSKMRQRLLESKGQGASPATPSRLSTVAAAPSPLTLGPAKSVATSEERVADKPAGGLFGLPSKPLSATVDGASSKLPETNVTATDASKTSSLLVKPATAFPATAPSASPSPLVLAQAQKKPETSAANPAKPSTPDFFGPKSAAPTMAAGGSAPSAPGPLVASAATTSAPAPNLSFGSKTTAAPTSSAPASASSFSFGSKPAANTPSSPVASSNPAFANPFGAKAGGPGPSSAPSSMPAFGLGKPPQAAAAAKPAASAFGSFQSPSSQAKPAEQPARGLLLSRLAPAPASEAPKPAASSAFSAFGKPADAPKTDTSASQPTFSFGKPAEAPKADSASKPLFSFGGSSSSTPAASAFGASAAAASPKPAEAPKPPASNFNFGGNSTQPAPKLAAVDTSKPTSAFGFGSGGPQSGAKPTAGAFGGFGASGAGSAFGTPAASTPGTPAANGFGTPAPTSAFGAPSTPSAFGSASSKAPEPAAKAADAPKFSFNFGGSTTPAAAALVAAGNAPAAPSGSFAFGSPAPAGGSSAFGSSTPSMAFGGAANPAGNAATKPAASPFGGPAPVSSPFGASATSTFNFGSPAPGSTFKFGK